MDLHLITLSRGDETDLMSVFLTWEILSRQKNLATKHGSVSYRLWADFLEQPLELGPLSSGIFLRDQIFSRGNERGFRSFRPISSRDRLITNMKAYLKLRLRPGRFESWRVRVFKNPRDS